jgi:S-adenosyl methyltransferase
MTTPGNVQPAGGAPDVDSTRASIARVYDAALGGTDNFAIDGQVLPCCRWGPVERCIAAAVGRKP